MAMWRLKNMGNLKEMPKFAVRIVKLSVKSPQCRQLALEEEVGHRLYRGAIPVNRRL